MSVVLDTNILVAGLYSRRGASYQLIKAAISGELSIAISPLIAFEYEGILHRKIDEGFLHISEDNCNQILNSIFSQASVVWKPIKTRPMLSDLSDDKILECAVSCNCTHIVTFNTKHFPSALISPWGIQVVTAGQFLHQWRNKL